MIFSRAFCPAKKHIAVFSLLFYIAAIVGCQKKEVPVITESTPSGIHQLNVLNAGFFTHYITSKKIVIAGMDGKIIIKDASSSQWRAAKTPDFTNKITSLAANENGSMLIAAGERGLLATSNDAGESWKKIPVPTDKTITTILFTHDVWIAAGEQGLILRGDATGNHWEKIALNSAATISKVLALPTQLIAIGENGLMATSDNSGIGWKIIPDITTSTLTDIAAGNDQIIISSADGSFIKGNLATSSWEKIDTGFSTYFSKIFYHQQQKVWICLSSDGDILLSDDGGNLWAPVAQGNHYLNGIAQSHDGKYLFAVGDKGQVLLSNNGGRTWTTQKTPVTTNIEGIIADGSTGFVAYGEAGLLMHLKNPQDNWEVINHPVESFVHQLLVRNENNWVAIGAKGTLLHSGNQGSSWHTIAAPIQESDYFLSIMQDKKSGNLITAGPPGTILIASKKSNEWKVRLALSDANQGYFHRVVGDNKGSIIAIAGPGITQYSTDAGENWSAATIDNDTQLFNATYDQYRQQFIAVGQAGTVQLSPDGKSWTRINTNISQSLQTVYATKNILWAAGDKGVLIYSTDGGKNWQNSTPDTQATLIALFETSEGNLIASGTQGTVLRLDKEDGRWHLITTPTQSGLRTPVQDQNTGLIYIPGKTGEIIYSTDDGLSWQLMPSITQGSIKSLHVDNHNKMLIGVGERLIKIPLLNRHN